MSDNLKNILVTKTKTLDFEIKLKWTNNVTLNKERDFIQEY